MTTNSQLKVEQLDLLEMDAARSLLDQFPEDSRLYKGGRDYLDPQEEQGPNSSQSLRTGRFQVVDSTTELVSEFFNH